MDTAAIIVRVVVANFIIDDYRVNPLKADNRAAVTVIVTGIFRIGRYKTVIYNRIVILEYIVLDNRSQMNRRIARIVHIDGIAVYVYPATLAGCIVPKDIAANRRFGHIVADHPAPAAVPLRPLKLPRYN